MANMGKPEGATHWHNNCKWAMAGWLKREDKQWFVWEEVGEEWLPVTYPDWLDSIKDLKEFKINNELTEKFRVWYVNGGKEKLEEAMERADLSSKEMKKLMEPDWSKINEPMTI